MNYKSFFCRSREFLWQEGHTAFATKEEADAEVCLSIFVGFIIYFWCKNWCRRDVLCLIWVFVVLYYDVFCGKEHFFIDNVYAIFEVKLQPRINEKALENLSRFHK